MKRLAHITTLLSALLLCAVMVSYGRIHPAKVKKQHFFHFKETNIGFYHGVRYFDVSKNNGYCCKNKPLMTGGIIVRMPIVNHFKAEVSIDYTRFLNFNKGDITKNIPAFNSAVSVPVSIQYYFLPKKSRLQPYFGAGTIVYSDVKNSLSLIEDGEIKTANIGTKYISVILTQGIIFEVNPRIQISESVHFINEGGRRSFGMNFGVGFKLP